MSKRLLRVSGIITAKVPVGRSSWYSGVQQGLWPRPIKLSARCSAWPEDEIDEVIRARASGASDAEIRQLVLRLHSARGGRWGEGSTFPDGPSSSETR